MKLLFCVVLFTVGAVVKAQQDYAFPDYWENDYDNFFDYNEASDASIENSEPKQTDTSKQIDTVIHEIKEETQVPKDPDSELDVMEDYQIEDNRSNSDEKEQAQEKTPLLAERVDENNKEEANEEPMPDDALENENTEEIAALPLEDDQQNNVSEEINKANSEEINEESSEKNNEENVKENNKGNNVENNDKNNEENNEETNENNDEEYNDEAGLDDDMWGDVVEDEVAPLPVPQSAEEVKDIFEETRNILNEDTQNFDEQQVEETVKPDHSEERNEQVDIDKIIEETKELLEENDDAFEAIYDNADEEEQEKSDEDFFSENNDEIEDETSQKVYADLNADLNKLFETLNKLSEDSSEEEIAEDNQYVDNIQDYEEKFSKPYKEDVVMSWRNSEANAANEEESSEQNEKDYENVDDSNLSDIFAQHALEENDSNDSKKAGEQELEGDIDHYDETVEEDVSLEQKEAVETPTIKNVNDYADNFGESLDSEPNANDEIDSVIKQIFADDIKEPQSYGNDALVDDKQPMNEDAAEFESIEANDTQVFENIEQKSVMVDDLSSAELSDLMTQFAIAHSEDLDVHSENFAKHVAPIHVTLSVDEPTIITSPNYPNPYPTNNIVDWIFEGPGTGIELNITDFAVNGAIGDYLLVKPGGLDESGEDGLIFSYRLTSERRYRFANVNRMFVRFQANPGWQYLTGFQFSVKMIWPLPQLADEVPIPEAVLNPPKETLVLNLAGLSLPKFNEVKEEFIELIADMASAYIKDRGIDRGLNTTLEVTQITKTAVCNIRWPNYESCVEVTFGVPLHYEEESEPRLNQQDLDVMWTSYIVEEQFASRLRSLGITEYAIPNDRSILMVWLVIAAGVVISMAMLAFALWRFSCFEDYTRMKAYSDTESIQNEKRHLDLYPTPHQTLPPLYSENDYKWADDKYDDSTRVDMGGFANKSYVRDELFDLDSDEDVIATRDRKGVISPRVFYDV